MKAKDISNILTGIAGVHYVVSEFSRRGMIALPTIRNTAAYDIIVVSRDGKRHANIQVKTSGKRAMFWRMPESGDVRTGPSDYYVLLRWIEREGRFECFLLSGRQARNEVRRGEKMQLRQIKRRKRHKLVPSIYIGRKRKAQSKQWETRWHDFRL